MFRGWDRAIVTATRYRMDGPGFETRWGLARDSLRRPSRPALQPTQPLYNGNRVSFPGVKRPGRGDDYPPPCNADVKERLQLYPNSRSVSSWHVIDRTLHLLTKKTQTRMKPVSNNTDKCTY